MGKISPTELVLKPRNEDIFLLSKSRFKVYDHNLLMPYDRIFVQSKE